MSNDTAHAKVKKILAGMDGSGYSMKAGNSLLVSLTAFNIPELYNNFGK